MLTATCRVFEVQRFSVHDGPGIRTTVFLAGCPLRCAWCQNPEGLDADAAPAVSIAALMAEVLRDQPYYDVSGGGLTLSGGEPLADRDAALTLLRAAREARLHVVVQTSGVVAKTTLLASMARVDLYQIDLKHMDPARHRALTGVDPARVHAAIDLLRAHDAALELRMPLVPDVNDDDANLDAVGRFLAARRIRAFALVPYQRLYLGKLARLGRVPALPEVATPTPERVQRAVARLGRFGVDVAVHG